MSKKIVIEYYEQNDDFNNFKIEKMHWKIKLPSYKNLMNTHMKNDGKTNLDRLSR